MQAPIRFTTSCAHRPGWLVVLMLCLVLMVTGCDGKAQPTPTPLPPTTTAVPATPTPVPVSSLVDDGYQAMARSDFAEAIAAFEEAYERDPAYAPAVVGLATAHIWQVGHEPRALELAQKAVELAPESAAAYTAQARAELNLYHTDKAVAAAEKAVALDDHSADAQAALARVYLNDYQYEASLEALERAIDLDPDLAAAYAGLGDYYLVVGDAARAQAAYARAIALQPQFAPWQVALGRLWYERGRFEQVQAALDKALTLMPDSADALMGLAYLAADRGDNGQAAARIDELNKLIPEAPQPYLVRGYLYALQEEYDDARLELRKALDRYPNHPTAIRAMAYAYLVEGECDLSIRQFQTLMAEYPRNLEGPMGMGYARLCEDDPVKALEYLRRAVKLDPFADRAHAGLATAYTVQERWDEANLAFAQALQVGLDDRDLHNGLGYNLYARDEREGARAEWELALALSSDQVSNSEIHSSLSSLSLMANKMADAETSARNALRLNPKDTDAQMALGTALISQGKYTETLKVMTPFVEHEPDDGFGHALLGLAYKGQERFSEAKDELEAFSKLNPEAVDSRHERLIDALSEGYHLTEGKALTDLVDETQQEAESDIIAQIANVGAAGRTLVMTTTADLDAEPLDLIRTMMVDAAVASQYVTRIRPAVPGGAVVRLVQEGNVTFELAVDITWAGYFADGIASAEGFVRAMTFKHIAPDAAVATVEEIKVDVSSTRALTPTADVPFQVVSEDELRQRYTHGLDDDDRAALRDNQAMLVLLGAIDPEADLETLLTDLSAEQVTGFYSPEEQVFYLVDRDETTAEDQMTAAHEIVHALQDQHFDLDALKAAGANGDAKLAIRALVEGDATLAMLDYGEEYVMLYDQMESVASAGGVEEATLDATPLFIRESQTFPYAAGLAFVSTLYYRGDWEGVDAAYTDLPRSTEQILHPERYLEGDEPRTVTLPDIADALGGEWQEVERDVMGELGMRLYLQEHIGPTMSTLAAEGWAGDSYVLLRRGVQGPYLLTMQTEWDDQDEADQFWAIYQKAMGHQLAYQEKVETLVGTVDHHWWHSDNTVVYARQDGKVVQIIIGPDAPTIEKVVSGLE